DAHRGDQRPEEFLLAAAERMLCVRCAAPAHFADLEQNLVRDVRHGVDHLREERRRAGDEEAEALRSGDRRVGAGRDGNGIGHRRLAAWRGCVHARTWPLPNTTHFWLVSPSSPTGPRACSLLVEIPISAPSPYSKPSAKRVEAFTITELESTSRRKRI